MVDIAGISTALSSAKKIKDMIQSAIDARDKNLINSSLIEIRSIIIDTQSDLLSALEERNKTLSTIGELQKKIESFEKWQEEKRRYDLVQLKQGIFAYRLREDARGEEPIHLICPNCYEKAEKSILQSVMRSPGRSEVYHCHRCQWDCYMTGQWLPQHAGHSP